MVVDGFKMHAAELKNNIGKLKPAKPLTINVQSQTREGQPGCYRCGSLDHFIAKCPHPDKGKGGRKGKKDDPKGGGKGNRDRRRPNSPSPPIAPVQGDGSADTPAGQQQQPTDQQSSKQQQQQQKYGIPISLARKIAKAGRETETVLSAKEIRDLSKVPAPKA